MASYLSDDEGVLYRQAHPELVDDGVPSSSVFRPTPKDEGKLSVDRSTLTSPKEAFELFLQKGYRSIAVFGVSVEEFKSERIRCIADPIVDSHPKNPAHALADYSQFGQNQRTKIAKRLKKLAVARGQLHPG